MDKVKALWNYVKAQVTGAPIPFVIGAVVGFLLGSL